jgi:hypothetical protein
MIIPHGKLQLILSRYDTKTKMEGEEQLIYMEQNDSVGTQTIDNTLFTYMY